MAVAIACPQCRAVMRSNAPIPAGKKIKCPKCANVFPAPSNGVAKSQPSASGTAGKPGVVGNRSSAQGVTPSRTSATGANRISTARPSATGTTSAKPKRKGGKFKKFVALLLFLGLVGGGLWVYSQISGNSTEPTTDSQAATTQATTATQAAPVAKVSDDPFCYFPTDATAFAGIEPAALLQVPVIKANADTVLKAPELALMIDELKRMTGLGPEELERVIVAGTGPVTADQPDSLVIVARSRMPVDAMKLAQLPDVIETKKGSVRPYYTLKSSALTQPFEVRACCTPIDRLVVVALGPSKRVEEIMNLAGTAPTPAADLLPLLRKAERTQLWTVVPFDAALRKQLETMLPAAQAMVPDLADSLKALAQAKAAGFWLGANAQEVRLSAGLLCPSDGVARDLAGSLGVVWAKTKPPVQEMLQPTVKELPGDMRDLIEDVFKSGAVSAEGGVAQVSIRLNMTPIEGLVKVSKAVGPQALMASIDQARIKGGLAPGGAPGIGENEKALLAQVGKTREDEELPMLKPDPKLFTAAAMLAKRAAKDGNFEAVNLEAVQEGVKESGYRAVALTANLGIAPGDEKYDPALTVQKWMNEEQPKNNLLNKEYNECGIGFATSEGKEHFIVLIFAKRQ